REGVEVVAPEVGELVTSLDMAGCSLTLTWLDEELERLWLAPVDTPAYRKGSVQIADTDESEEDVLLPGSASESSVEIVSAEGRRTARCAARVLRSVAEVLRESEAELGELDAVAGDGDHGRGMTRGSSVALAAAEAEAERGSLASVLAAPGRVWAQPVARGRRQPAARRERCGERRGALSGSSSAATALEQQRTSLPRPRRRAQLCSGSVVRNQGTRRWWTPWSHSSNSCSER